MNESNTDSQQWLDKHDVMPDYLRTTDGRPYDMTPPVICKTFKGRVVRAFARLQWIDPDSGEVLKWDRPVTDRDGETSMWSDDHIVSWRPDPDYSYPVEIVSVRTGIAVPASLSMAESPATPATIPGSASECCKAPFLSPIQIRRRRSPLLRALIVTIAFLQICAERLDRRAAKLP